MSTRHIDESELLKRFTELAPAEWGVRPTDGGHFHMTDSDGYINGVHLANDLFGDTPEIIIRLWDYLEGEGMKPLICADRGGYRCVCGADDHGNERYSGDGRIYQPEPFPSERVSFVGKTRIEAVVRACVALWESRLENADRDVDEGGNT